MHKQELIDATEASGLSRAPVGYGCRCLTWFSIRFNVLPAIVLSEVLTLSSMMCAMH